MTAKGASDKKNQRRSTADTRESTDGARSSSEIERERGAVLGQPKSARSWLAKREPPPETQRAIAQHYRLHGYRFLEVSSAVDRRLTRLASGGVHATESRCDGGVNSRSNAGAALREFWPSRGVCARRTWLIMNRTTALVIEAETVRIWRADEIGSTKGGQTKTAERWSLGRIALTGGRGDFVGNRSAPRSQPFTNLYARERFGEVVCSQGLAEFESLSVPSKPKATDYEPSRPG